MKKDIVCDSGVLISLTSGCLDRLLYHFFENHSVRFILPPSVFDEVVTRPFESNLRKHLFSAVRIKTAIEDGVLTVVDAKVQEETKRIMNAANSMFYVKGNPIRLVHYGESEMLALALDLGISDILMDERTTRILIEAPFKLKEHLEAEFNVNVMINKNSFKELTTQISKIKTIRTSELIMLAYEDGFFKNFGKAQKQVLEAALYKVKYVGCSISFNDITSYLSMVK